jgi:dihydrodipicolinate synthase/N-acetylneuraminate lyase
VSSLSVGGAGVVLVLSNIIPAEVVALVKSFKRGNFEEAKKFTISFCFLLGPCL